MTLSKEQVINYFAGNATILQKKMVEEWLRSPANQELYFEWLEEWERQYPQYMPDIDKAAERFGQRLDNTALPDSPSPVESEVTVGRINRFFPWAAAAVVFLGLLTSLYIYRDQLQYKTYETAYGQTKVLPLPDGSVVTLNGHSKLRLSRFGFGKSTREVWLTGEAVFDVKHTVDDQRFIVRTPNQLQVEVLGTEFSVNTRARGTQVALNRGKVKLKYQNTGQTANELVMAPGDWVALTKRGELKRGRRTDPQQFAAWRDHRFVFDNTPLREVASMLNESYGIAVEIADPQLAMRPLTGSFRARTQDELLDAIAQLLDVSITQKDKTIIIMSPTTNL